MGDERGELTDKDCLVCAKRGASEIERLSWGWRKESGSWIHCSQNHSVMLFNQAIGCRA